MTDISPLRHSCVRRRALRLAARVWSNGDLLWVERRGLRDVTTSTLSPGFRTRYLEGLALPALPQDRSWGEKAMLTNRTLSGDVSAVSDRATLERSGPNE
jgi:hypothetical protein